jgi:hypothetical protein
MKSMNKWGPIAVTTLLLVSGFQNCSPVAFKESEEALASKTSVDVNSTPTPTPTSPPGASPTPVSSPTPKSSPTPVATPTPTPVQTATPVIPKDCDLEKKKNGETWMSAAGQDRVEIACKVGTGVQWNVFNISKEYICNNGTASLTGRVDRVPAGMEGVCNVDCGDHKNNDLWWKDLATSVETLQCATSSTTTSQVTYQNTAEYKCLNAVSSATGNTKKTKLSETSCPDLTFNDQNNQATLAFEDVPSNSDSDYNDFVTNIKVSETYSSLGELTKIVLEYAAKYKESGLDHKLISVFDGNVRGRDGWVSNQSIFKSEAMFVGDASIKYELYTNGVLAKTVNNVAKAQDLVVFESTGSAYSTKQVARITITGIDGKQNLLSVRKGLSIKRYRTLLYIHEKNNSYDVDIAEINPSAFDNHSKPVAIFVPLDWHIPKEGMNIDAGYPDFQAHADFMKNATANASLVESDKAKNWFNNIVLKNVMP